MPLSAVAENLWVTAQPLRFLGLEVGTRMTIVRLGSGDLVLISPVRLVEGDRPSLDRLGTVAHLVAPNLFHHMFMTQAQALYPQAKTWGVAGLAQKRPDLRLDGLVDRAGCLEEVLEYQPVDGFAALMPQGICLANETVFFHRPSRTLIVTDIAFNFDETSSLGMQLAARVLGSYQALRPTLMEKWGTRNKAEVEASLRKVLAWDFDRVILTHGSIVERDGKAALREGYEWFLGRSPS
ncbi:MAG: DUF4336 domain-containing protein [Synechococcales cyanobacterium RU_4_20]|nr:DUF4336 domain-containing protein [Synechococcales cyanobacterium RU_4_20]NJR68989.1 DUF4336 domain-containing protein [Synechococcales cyanobacterium CRU_2_2]